MLDLERIKFYFGTFHRIVGRFRIRLSANTAAFSQIRGSAEHRPRVISMLLQKLEFPMEAIDSMAILGNLTAVPNQWFRQMGSACGLRISLNCSLSRKSVHVRNNNAFLMCWLDAYLRR